MLTACVRVRSEKIAVVAVGVKYCEHSSQIGGGLAFKGEWRRKSERCLRNASNDYLGQAGTV